MTKNEILKISKYIIIPNYNEYIGTQSYDEYKTLLGNSTDVVYMETNKEEDRLIGCQYNEHHYTMKWIYENLMPTIFSKLGIKFNPLDFYKVSNFQTVSGKVFDFSYLLPYKNNSIKLEYFNYNFDKHNKNVYYRGDIIKEYGDISMLIAKSKDEVANCKFLTDMGKLYCSPYHMLYKCPHQSSRITNLTIDSDRKLVISCNSHMIPLISLLACYFKEITILDNRVDTTNRDFFEDTYFTDSLIVLCPINNLEHFIIDNFS